MFVIIHTPSLKIIPEYTTRFNGKFNQKPSKNLPAHPAGRVYADSFQASFFLSGWIIPDSGVLFNFTFPGGKNN
jgi:hypothetical protein